MYQVEIYLSRRLDSVHLLSIHNWYIEITKEEHTQTIDWKDVMAIKEISSDSQLTKIELLLFKLKKRFLRARKREQQSLIFYTSPQNVELLLKKVRQFVNHSPLERPRLMLLHNPIAGSNSRRHLNTCVEFLSKTHYKWEVIRTQYRGFCLEYLNKLTNPQDYFGIVIISGDGLMHQYVNALIDIPVCHIPAGSGNAFSKTQATEAGQNCSVKETLYLAIKGQKKKFSLARFTLEHHSQPIYSCLSLEWGFLADIDMGSQFLRFLGALRFQVYSVWRWLFLKRYRARVSYTETETPLPPMDRPIENNSFVIQQKQYLNALFCSIPYISEKYNVAPLLDLSSASIDMQLNESEAGRWKFLKYLLSFESGAQFDKEKRIVQPSQKMVHKMVKSYRLEPLGDDKGQFGIDGQHYPAQNVQCQVVPERLWMFTFN